MHQIKRIVSQSISPTDLKELLASYSHVELTEEEHDRAILEAKMTKDERLKYEARQKRAEENRRALTETRWSVEQFAEFAKWRAAQLKKPLVLDEYNSNVFDLLCLYFAQDPNFEKMALEMDRPLKNPSLKKGLLLCGNPGTGKTFLIQLFARNQRQGFQVVNASFIADKFVETGSLDLFLDLDENAVNDSSNFFQKVRGLCIDDLGTESEKNHFGNRVNVIGQLIESKYSRNLVGDVLHATTNLTGQELKNFYGDRVVSRMKEIFNLIEVPGPDRRK